MTSFLPPINHKPSKKKIPNQLQVSFLRVHIIPDHILHRKLLKPIEHIPDIPTPVQKQSNKLFTVQKFPEPRFRIAFQKPEVIIQEPYRFLQAYPFIAFQGNENSIQKQIIVKRGW